MPGPIGGRGLGRLGQVERPGQGTQDRWAGPGLPFGQAPGAKRFPQSGLRLAIAPADLREAAKDMNRFDQT